jgi:hypothetical protein
MNLRVRKVIAVAVAETLARLCYRGYSLQKLNDKSFQGTAQPEAATLSSLKLR